MTLIGSFITLPSKAFKAAAKSCSIWAFVKGRGDGRLRHGLSLLMAITQPCGADDPAQARRR